MPWDARHVDLPLELVQQILRLCRPPEWTTLMHLSKGWKDIVEMERYKSIHVFFEPSPFNSYGAPLYLRLFSTLEHNPHLACRVHSFAVSIILAGRAWSGRCLAHNSYVNGPCKREQKRPPSQILSSTIPRRNELIRKCLNWTGLVRLPPRSRHMYSEAALRKVAKRDLFDCNVRANENTTIILAGMILALKNCVNLHTLDLRDHFPIPTLYGQALSVAIDASPKLRQLYVSQEFVTKEMTMPIDTVIHDDLSRALVRTFSCNQPDVVDVATFDSGKEILRKILVINGEAGWTVEPHDMERLRWLATEGVSVVTRRRTFVFCLFISHYATATASAFDRYIADVSGHIESLLHSRTTGSGDPLQLYRLGWYAPPGQIQISLFTWQLDPQLGRTISAVSGLNDWVRCLILVFCVSDDLDDSADLPQISVARLVEMVAPLQQLERMILQKESFLRVNHPVQASTDEVLAMARAAGMRKLQEVRIY